MRDWRKSRHAIAFGTIFLLLSLGGSLKAEEQVSFTNWGRGLISVRNQYPFAMLHSSLRPDSPAVLLEGKRRASLHFAWTNTNLVEPGYKVDCESREFRFGLAYNVWKDTELSVEVPLLYRGGGLLDPLIDGWHKFFSMPRGDRDEVSDNLFEISGRNVDDSSFNLEESGTGFGNVYLRIKHLLSPGDEFWPAWTLAFNISLPSISDGLGHRSVDVSPELLFSKRFGSWIVYGAVAFMFYGDSEIEGLHFHDKHYEGYLGVEYEWSKQLSLITDVYAASDLLQGVEGHIDSAFYHDFGLRYALSQKHEVEMLLRENLTGQEASADISFVLGMRVAF